MKNLSVILLTTLVTSSGIAATQDSNKQVPTSKNKAANTSKTSRGNSIVVETESVPASRSEKVYQGTEKKLPPAALQPEPTLANPPSRSNGTLKSAPAN